MQLAEKPPIGSPILSSRNVLGIVGRYLVQPGIVSALRELRARGRARTELTDALQLLVTRGGKVCAYEIEAKRNHVGPFLDKARGLITGLDS